MTGAKVTLTDKRTALKTLTENLKLNLQEIPPTLVKEDNSCTNDLCREDHSLDTVSPPVIQELDWCDRTSELLSRKWDFVIGADVIYIKETFVDLLETMKHLDTGAIFLSCRLRYDKDWEFIGMTKPYFIVEELFYDENRDIHIFKFYKS